MDDPRKILREAGVVCAEVNAYADHRVEPLHAFSGAGRLSSDDPHEMVSSAKADAAIIALAKLVADWKQRATWLAAAARDAGIIAGGGAGGSGPDALGCVGGGGFGGANNSVADPVAPPAENH